MATIFYRSDTQGYIRLEVSGPEGDEAAFSLPADAQLITADAYAAAVAESEAARGSIAALAARYDALVESGMSSEMASSLTGYTPPEEA